VAKVEYDGVDKIYDDGFQAVDNLNLVIEDGEFVILVGPSGCGKSTALRMVAGLEHITRGDVRIGGKVVNHLTAKQRDIAMVFQSYALYPHMSVGENMGFALKISRITKDEAQERVREAAEVLGLTELLDRKPRELSGGQRQRVAMGRAIVRKPQAFLMDEPLSNLDAKLRVQMRAEIASLQNRLGTTMLYVTHDQIEAMTMGDRVAVLNGGVLQQVAAPQELYDHPDNLFVAGFIGSPAMNLARARIGGSAARPTIELSDGQEMVVPDAALAEYPAVAQRIGQEVAVGLRPEHFVRQPRSEHTTWRDVRVELVEMLGAEMLVHIAVGLPPVLTEQLREALDDDDAFEAKAREAEQGGQRFVARFEPGNAPAVGDVITVGFKAERLNFFDLATGAALR
jgi:multiple sugar transport system ATP-binding protein